MNGATRLRQGLKREAVKFVLGRLLSWDPLEHPEPGFSIILGVPWDLRHLLPVNLRFLARTDLGQLRRLHVVFDRPPRAGAEAVITQARELFPALPLTFRFHPPLSGWIVNRVNASKFYNSMNTVLGLRDCTTRYAVLHDFDLYPLVPTYFTEIVDALAQRRLRFCGLERTHFDGLTSHDNILGTWALGIDVQWLRAQYRPVDCFHRVARLRGRLVDLDPYSYVQTHTPERALLGTLDRSACCHVLNLCSTYLRFRSGLRPNVVWRLHYLWYLEHLCGQDDNFVAATLAMERAVSSKLRVQGVCADFSNVHWTCSNVLRDELDRMERALFGECRPEVARYVGAFAEFLLRLGDRRSIEELQGGPVARAASS